MKREIALIRYHYQVFLASNKYIVPFLILVVYLSFAYRMSPFFIVDSYTISMVFIFYLMAWIGSVWQEAENPVSEQLILLKCGSEKIYYISKLAAMQIFGLYMSLIAVLCPLVIALFSRGSVFTRTLEIRDVACSFVLCICAAFCGSMTGSFLHPRVLKERKIAAMLTIFFGVIGLVKTGVTAQLPAFQWIAWIFPPVAEFIAAFTKEDYYSLNQVFLISLLLIGYALVLFVIQTRLLIKNKF